jgi:hypothetical protein
MKLSNAAAAIVLTVFLAGCATLVLQPANFAWPIELVLKPDAKGMVHDVRYEFNCNIKPLLFEERQDSIHVSTYTLRIIRDQAGYYYITGKGFKNVYIFAQTEGALKLDKKIQVSEKELEAPAFNQKTSFIQLVNEENENVAPILINKDGIQQGEKK